MNEPINIAIIAGQLVVGGAERQLYLWLSHLDRQKFNPVVLTLHPGYADFWEVPIEELGIPLYMIPHRQTRLIRLCEIIRVLKPFHPQLIHGWHLFASAYAGVAASVLATKSLAGIRHTYDAFLANPLEARLTLLTVDAILTNSKNAACELSKEKLCRKKQIFTVPNAVETPAGARGALREKLSRQFNISGEKVWIGSIGRLDPLKKFDLALVSFSQVFKVHPDLHFILIGDGPEMQKLQSLVQKLGIAEHVTFTGEIPNAKDMLPALDIFCFSSVDEGMPNVVMEAAAAGLPILTWKLPFYEEILEHGRTGILVEAGNVADFKFGLINLIEQPILRERLGEESCKDITSRFSLPRFVNAMTDVYASVLGKQA